MHMLCECTGNTELVLERRIWIQRMRKIIKDTLNKKMRPALYEVLLGLWNVDDVGKINEWVTDDRLNLEAAENDPKLLQLRLLIDKQNGVDNHMYGITTTVLLLYGMEKILGRLSGDHASNCADIPSRLTQMYAACY